MITVGDIIDSQKPVQIADANLWPVSANHLSEKAFYVP